jgi:hypothetical protein
MQFGSRYRLNQVNGSGENRRHFSSESSGEQHDDENNEDDATDSESARRAISVISPTPAEQ